MEKEYIATQGPMSNTIGHFARMVWDQNCRNIVMLNQLVEKGKTFVTAIFFIKITTKNNIFWWLNLLTLTKLARVPLQNPNKYSSAEKEKHLSFNRNPLNWVLYTWNLSKN